MRIYTFVLVFVLLAHCVFAQYDPQLLFSPQQYPVGGNSFRNGAGEPGPQYWQNRADYILQARLEEGKNEIIATVEITYTNNSPQALSFIWLTLEQNLFNNTSRGYAKLPVGGRSRYGSNQSVFQGGFTFQSVKLFRGSQSSWLPDKVDTLVNDTRMQVRLATPLAPGSKLKLSMDYRFRIPQQGADRTGVLETDHGKIFSIAQWYPRVCVYDDITGWNTDPYLGAGEFYLEYGSFQASISVPSDHIVVCSGSLMNPEEVLSPQLLKRYQSALQSDETVIIKSKEDILQAKKAASVKYTTWKYQINNSRDLAWASSKAFIWDGCRVKVDDARYTFAQSVYPIESDGYNAWGRSTEYIKGSLTGYSQRWFPYPYPAAVNVACNISGMEYPGIIFCSWEDQGESLWGVTDHELGHTWFPMIVGSNERRYGWMDEGFNTFINQISSDDFNDGEYGQPELKGQAVATMITDKTTEKVMLTPDGMAEKNIGLNLYYKPAIALSILRNHVVGPQRFDYAFRKYIRDWAYKHPTPWDFFRSMENSTGEDLYWFWKGLILENMALDQSIRSVVNGAEAGEIVVTIDNLKPLAMPLIVEVTSMTGKTMRKSFPVEIWQSSGVYQFRLKMGEKVRKLVIDPDGVFPDIDTENNVWSGLR